MDINLFLLVVLIWCGITIVSLRTKNKKASALLLRQQYILDNLHKMQNPKVRLNPDKTMSILSILIETFQMKGVPDSYIAAQLMSTMLQFNEKLLKEDTVEFHCQAYDQSWHKIHLTVMEPEEHVNSTKT